MGSAKTDQTQRSGSRTKAVLPVRVKGNDASGASFEELAHTLDVTAAGLRLGAVRRELKLHDVVTVFYRQRRIEYRVVWVNKLKGTSEFQVGLQSVSQAEDALWLSSPDCKVQSAPVIAAAPGAA